MNNIVLNAKGALNWGVSPGRPRTAICHECDSAFLESTREPKRARKEKCFRCSKQVNYPNFL